jgi:hypothetical protein
MGLGTSGAAAPSGRIKEMTKWAPKGTFLMKKS